MPAAEFYNFYDVCRQMDPAASGSLQQMVPMYARKADLRLLSKAEQRAVEALRAALRPLRYEASRCVTGCMRRALLRIGERRVDSIVQFSRTDTNDANVGYAMHGCLGTFPCLGTIQLPFILCVSVMRGVLIETSSQALPHHVCYCVAWS